MGCVFTIKIIQPENENKESPKIVPLNPSESYITDSPLLEYKKDPIR